MFFARLFLLIALVPTPNRPPVANAGGDQTAAAGSIVTLNGSRSTDPDGNALTYTWRLMSRPAGSLAALDNPNDVTPTFKVDVAGNYVVRLVVNDGVVDSLPDTVTISRANSRPVAKAGRDQTVAIGSTARLDGSGSSDVDGDRLQFTWSIAARPEGSSAVLANSNSVSPTFVADAAGRYIVRLTVSDGDTVSAADTVTISTTNSTPAADAGPDQTASVGSSVILNGSKSTDADGDSLAYSWSFISRPAGSSARLSDASAVLPSFVADRAGTYVVQLIVADAASVSAPDTVMVTTRNSAPIANAGAVQTAGVGALVLLDGSGSSDPDGDVLNYSWSLTNQPAGSAATIAGPLTQRPSFVLDRAGTYVVQLIVSDGKTKSVPSTVTINTRNSPPVAHAGADQLTGHAGDEMKLFGNLSTDPDGDPLTYSWSIITRPQGSASSLSGRDITNPTFTPDIAGAYVVQLVVNDGLASSAPDTLLIHAEVSIDTVSVTATDPSASETGPDSGTFTFTRTGPTGAARTILYTVGGTATNGVDYTPTLNGSITIPAGQTSTTLTITPVDDALIEGDETVTIKTKADIPSSATITITDNDAPTVTVTATDANASEAGTDPGTFTFTRTGPTTAPLTVSYSVGGSASNGIDYTPTLSGTVTIAAGQASATITITPIDDSDIEGDETAVLTLTANAAYTIGGSGNATVTITDNDLPAVTVSASDASANEAGPDPGTITFTRTGPTTSALVVTYSIGGTAANGTDYVPTLNGTLTIPAGQASADVVITPVKDNLVESPETVVLTLQSGSGYTVGAPNAGAVTIADDPAIVNIVPTDTAASEAGADPGTLTFTRTGGDQSSALTVNFAISGNAVNGTDYTLITTSITIPANQSSAAQTIVPIADNIVESAETVTLTISNSSQYTIGMTGAGTVTIADDPVIVTVAATDPNASETGPDPGVFTFSRSGGDVSSALQVFFSRSGTATEDVDYVNLGPGFVTIAANELSKTLTVMPIVDQLVEPDETVIATITSNAAYTIGAPANATVTIHDLSTVPLVSVSAIDSSASETGPDPGVFRFTRTGSTSAALTVNYTVGGTATNGADYVAIGSSIVIPVGQASTDLTITPIADGLSEPTETVVVTITDTADYDPGSPATATVNIADAGSACGPEGGPLTNGATHCGAISNPGETDVWTFSATVGDRIGVHIGEVIDNNGFSPWIRVITPTGATLGSSYGVNAAALEVVANATGTYQVLVASFDSGLDGTGTYLLTMAHTPGPITITAGDEGGPLTNGATHTGAIFQGDLDVWTFSATAGDRIDVHIGEITDSNGVFAPWIRIWAPNGASLGGSYGSDAAALEVVASVTGNYLVLVGSYNSGFNGAGTYRLTLTKSPGPITISSGDQGGPLTNGATHTGEITRGDVDAWTFTATAGDRIDVHIGQITDNGGFTPWIRIWAPNGASLGGSYGTGATALEVVASVTGNYLVLVGSYNSGFNGAGTYQLTFAKSPGPITISSGDQGGPLTNGATHTGEITMGDLDTWTFTATAGDRIDVHIGEIIDNGGFSPWIRIWAPNGASLGGSYGSNAAALEVVANVTGDYLVLVGSYDSGYDGTGTYRLTMTHTPGPITISPNDEGGPLTNGAIHTGAITQGDLDVWTFTATAGDRIDVHIGELVDSNGVFAPWIRIWAPNGASLGGSYGSGAAALEVVANVTGNYLVLVGSYNSGYTGTGTYQLTMTHTPGPITVSSGDQGGPMTNGAMHLGEITQGDLDVWTFTANAGERIDVHIGEIVDNSGTFAPWIRIWAPNGASLGGAYGADAAALEVLANVTGTYLVLVGSFDSGYDGAGTYRLTVAHTGEPVTVSPGDQGGPIGAGSSGEIVRGDLDVWTFSAVAGERISITINETSGSTDFTPWIRVWAVSNGATLGSASGAATATINVVIPATGTYMVPVGSFDSGYDGTGTYTLTLGHF